VSFDTFVGFAGEREIYLQQRPTYYRDLAARCVLMAAETSATDHKAALLDMARRWVELAQQVERSEIEASDPNNPAK
jgi:hypothetical protein